MIKPRTSPTSHDQALHAASRVTAQRVAVNTLANILYYGLQAITLLGLQAYVVRSVGVEEYSVWPLCRTCMALAALIQVGIGAGTSRYIAIALGKQDIDEIHRITSTMFFAFTIGAVAYASVFSLIAWQFENIFSIADSARGVAMPTMLLLGLAGAILMPFSVFEGTLIAAQERVRLNLIRSTILVARVLLIVAIFQSYGPSIIWIAASQLVISIAESILLHRVAGKVFPWQRLRRKDVSLATLRKINTFSVLTLVLAISGRLYYDADIIIINKMLDPGLVAGYAIVTTLLMNSYAVTRLASTAFSSPFAILYARGETQRIYQSLRRCNMVAVPAGATPILFLAFHGESFLRVYIGEEFVSFASIIPWLGFGLILSQTQTLNSSIPAAMGRVRLPAIASIIAALGNVFISVALVGWFGLGIHGVVAGTLTMLVLYRVGFWTGYSARLLGIPQKKFYWEIVCKPLGQCFPAIAIFGGALALGIGDHLAELVAIGVVAVLAQLFYTLRLGLDSRDRDRLISYFSKVAQQNRLVAALLHKT